MSQSPPLSHILKTLHLLSYIKHHIHRLHFSPKDTILNTSKIAPNMRAYALMTLKMVCWYDAILSKIRAWLHASYPQYFTYEAFWDDATERKRRQDAENERIREDRRKCEVKSDKKATKWTANEEALIFTQETNPLYIEFLLYCILIEKNEAFLEQMKEFCEQEDHEAPPNKSLLPIHWQWTRAIHQLTPIIQDKLASIMKEENKISVEEFIPKQLLEQNATTIYPKYIRPNRHKGVTAEQLEELLIANGLSKGTSLSETKQLCTQSHKTHAVYFPDDLIPGLFVIPHDFPVHQLEEFNSGRIIVQDKSSCVPPVVLVETLKRLKYLNNKFQKIAIVDGCAAPGNKTSLLGELLLEYPNATVHALEIDKRRCDMLRKRMKQFGAKNIQVHQADFLKHDFKSIKYLKAIMLDPSCSGSGMEGRESFVLEYDSEDRIEKLAAFQEKMLRHALHQPNVEVVTYSTCSTHDRENELVMMHTQEKVDKDGKYFQFYPVCSDLPEENRGKPLQGEETRRCLRFNADKDLCGGFFVGCFVREASLAHRDPKSVVWKNGREAPSKDKKRKRKSKGLNEKQLARKKRRQELQKELYGEK